MELLIPAALVGPILIVAGVAALLNAKASAGATLEGRTLGSVLTALGVIIVVATVYVAWVLQSHFI